VSSTPRSTSATDDKIDDLGMFGSIVGTCSCGSAPAVRVKYTITDPKGTYATGMGDITHMAFDGHATASNGTVRIGFDTHKKGKH
jgi:hypothetical protein